VRVAALELGLAGRIEEIRIAVAPNKPNETFASSNPLMKIPALDTGEGAVLYDSRVICEYLDSVAGGGRLFPAQGAQRWDALRRQSLGDGILDAGILRRYELALRPAALRWDEWLAGQQRKVELGLDAAEREAGGWGDAFDIGHLTLACALGWLDFRFGEQDWRGSRPALSAWFARAGARPSMMQTPPQA
jgi:glutathione S-transferase